MYAIVNHLEFTKPVDDFREIVQNEEGQKIKLSAR
jgi:hypothetical protein